MLTELRARDERFKTVVFKPGLNLIIADITKSSTRTDTRNGVGKSAVVELLHFLLGGRADSGGLLARPALRAIEFELELEWPRTATALRTWRAAENATQILVYPNPLQTDTLIEMAGSLSLTEWQRVLEEKLFALPEEHQGVSGRAMLALYMRRIRSHAFNEHVKTSPQQSPAEASANVSYLLGLDWKLAARYRDLAARESTRQKLAQASKDPVWGRIVGRSAELRGQMTVAQQRVLDLERQVAEFRVVPEYENLQGQADELEQRIRRTRTEDSLDRRNLRDLEYSLRDVTDPDVDYLEAVYSGLGVTLGDAVQRRFEEVRDFHTAVIQNRRSYLEDELTALRGRLEARASERSELGEELANALRLLNEGGALAALNALQQGLASARADLGALRHRFEAARTLEASRSEIRAERGQLESRMRADLLERDQLINEVSVRFLRYATELYGPGREAYLEFDPTPTHLRITPHIDSIGSRGIGNMVTFCFDLTVAVTAQRGGRGPDFLVHDSHLFDGVDARQVARSLALAREVAEAEGIQYIATLNSDDLAKAQEQGFDASSDIIEPRLTDRYEDGGLFGFRFA